MSNIPIPTTSRSNLNAIFTSAFQAYKEKTGNDITSHPLAIEFQSCHSPHAILAVLYQQIPLPGQSRSTDEGFTKWLIPTVNVLFAFSVTLGEGVGLIFSPAKAIFAGIGIFLLAVKDASASQDTLIDLFNRIEFFFRRLEIYTEVPPTVAMSEVLVKIMVEVLMILGIATEEMKRGRIKKYINKLIGKTDIEDSLKRLDKLTHEEVRMASVEQLKITHSVERIVTGVDDKMAQANMNQLRDSLLRWLSPSDTSTNHNIAMKAHHNGTAQWFLQRGVFKDWKYAGSFLWVHGKPGSGKSVLCSSIIQDIVALHDVGKALIAYFYFDFRDIDKQGLRNLLPSLLIQLSARSKARCDVLSQLYAAHDRGVRKPHDRAMIECFKEMLALEMQRPTYIIMDAIDECPTRMTSGVPSPREEVLELVGELIRLHLPNLHICVTSRPELDIRKFLGPLASHAVSLHDENGQKQDIADYVRSFVQSDRRMQKWRDEDQELVIRTLSEKAEGMFRWAFCQLDALRHCIPQSVRRIIEELPESLDETYERILREIRKSNQVHARRLLQCLVAAARPLRVEELAEVLAVDFDTEGSRTPKLNPAWQSEDEEEAVMSACSSLVMVVEYGYSRIVQFSHYSVVEFLTSDRLAEASSDISRYHIPLESAHTILAQACLGVLLQLDDRIDRYTIKNFPLAQYAAERWVDHARFGNVASCTKAGMECLFDVDKPHFATWRWIYNRERHSSMSTMCPEKPEQTPLYYAAKAGFHNLTKHLLARYPEDVHAKGGYEVTPLHAVARLGYPDIFSLLIEHFPDADTPGPFYQTPLHRASRGGHLEIAQQLLDRGADVNASDEDDWTPLYMAAVDGHLEFAQMLLERGAAINTKSQLDNTPLHVASVSGNIEVVRLLLEHGADPNVCNKVGHTPFEVASSEGRREIARLLSEYSTRPAKE